MLSTMDLSKLPTLDPSKLPTLDPSKLPTMGPSKLLIMEPSIVQIIYHFLQEVDSPEIPGVDLFSRWEHPKLAEHGEKVLILEIPVDQFLDILVILGQELVDLVL